MYEHVLVFVCILKAWKIIVYVSMLCSEEILKYFNQYSAMFTREIITCNVDFFKDYRKQQQKSNGPRKETTTFVNAYTTYAIPKLICIYMYICVLGFTFQYTIHKCADRGIIIYRRSPRGLKSIALLIQCISLWLSIN